MAGLNRRFGPATASRKPTSVIAFYAGWTGETSHAVLDALGVLWATSLFSTVFRSGRQNRFYGFVTRYTKIGRASCRERV